MRFLLFLLCILLVRVSAAWCDEGHQHDLTEQEVGSVHFTTSCAKAVQTDFQRAVALLHSFQYEQARAAFQAIAKKDPKCAMAQWGIAMSHYHGLWENGDTAAGREAIRKAQQFAGTASVTTRERSYIDALSEIYREDDNNAYVHGQAFERKMAELQASYPDDSEAAIFHALTLDIIAPKTDKTFANQRKCVEILVPLFAKQQSHPGIAHYIIHCSDNPVLAEAALPAARKYAAIAPASAHANHMPSHIFTRVGSWDESIKSNLRSAELAKQAEATSTNGEARDQRLHAMDYLEYAYLQQGRVKDAEAILDEMKSLAPVPGLTLTGTYAQAAVPARYTLELGKWEDASHLEVSTEGVPWAQAITWMAVGMGASHSKNLARAAEAEKNLARLRDAAAQQKNTYWSSQIEVQRQEVAASILQASGKSAEATAAMRYAADLEESMDKSPVTPGAVVPARELLAQLLQEQARPQEAIAEYEAVLKTAPNRFNALWGAASSAETAGNAAVASKYFRKLADVGVGSERPELEAARKKAAGAVARN
jgi:tetratricopeptide (TPR) repeat protein